MILLPSKAVVFAQVRVEPKHLSSSLTPLHRSSSADLLVTSSCGCQTAFSALPESEWSSTILGSSGWGMIGTCWLSWHVTHQHLQEVGARDGKMGISQYFYKPTVMLQIFPLNSLWCCLRQKWLLL